MSKLSKQSAHARKDIDHDEDDHLYFENTNEIDHEFGVTKSKIPSLYFNPVHSYQTMNTFVSRRKINDTG